MQQLGLRVGQRRERARDPFEQLIRDHGGEIRTGADVAEVIVDESGRATGVLLASGERISASEGVICSMTPAERNNPSVINGSRRVRIAKGSGVRTGVTYAEPSLLMRIRLGRDTTMTKDMRLVAAIGAEIGRHILDQAQHRHFELVKQPLKVPFVIRETQHKFQHTLSEVTFWKRIR